MEESLQKVSKNKRRRAKRYAKEPSVETIDGRALENMQLTSVVDLEAEILKRQSMIYNNFNQHKNSPEDEAVGGKNGITSLDAVFNKFKNKSSSNASNSTSSLLVMDIEDGLTLLHLEEALNQSTSLNENTLLSENTLLNENTYLNENASLNESPFILKDNASPKKAKKNRRRRRELREKKQQALKWLNFEIKAIKSHKNYVFFKRRNIKNRRISVQTFCKQCSPYIFETKFGSDGAMAEASNEKELERLSLDNFVKSDKAKNSNLNLQNPTSLQNLQKPTRNELDPHRIEQNNSSKNSQGNKNLPHLNDSENSQHSPGSQSKRNNRKRTQNVETKKREFFRPYLSYQDVEIGLESGRLFSGVIRINPKNFKEAYVNNTDRNVQDYLIPSVVDRNKALEGDVVVLELKPVGEWRDGQKTATVVFIKDRVHRRTAVGYLSLKEDKHQKFVQLTPKDHRIPRIRIQRMSWPPNFHKDHKSYKNVMFLAKITDWTDTRFAVGTILENIGKNRDLKAETRAILLENELDITPFPPEVYDYIPKTNEIPAREFEYRMDLRKECIFTIDPLTARDLDDAVSCKVLPNGNLEIGVHIADVSHYLQDATPLDIIVSKRATTIYLVDNVYHMLPVELCGICSLLPGKDCLAFSVIWEMTESGEIIDTKFGRSVINSCCQLAYEHAQRMIDDPNNFSTDGLPEITNGFKVEQIADVVNKLQKIALKYRSERFKNGALKIDQVKLCFRIDPSTGLPSEFSVYENKEAHRLIEEFMLLANMTVAAKILDHFPQLAFLRCHEPPNPRMMADIKKSLETIGMHFEINSSAGIHWSLEKYGADSSFLGECRMQVLHHLLAKPMTRATYFCAGLNDNHHHYALNAPVYTHFTSPIRRYADVMVHRLLAASLQYCSKPTWDMEFVRYIADICNKQKYNAKKAGEMHSDLFLAHYIESHQPFIETAVVVDVKNMSYDVILVKTGSIIRLYFNTIDEDTKCDLLPIGNGKHYRATVTFPTTPTNPQCQVVIQMFQIIKIQVFRKDNTSKLSAKLQRP